MKALVCAGVLAVTCGYLASGCSGNGASTADGAPDGSTGDGVPGTDAASPADGASASWPDAAAMRDSAVDAKAPAADGAVANGDGGAVLPDPNADGAFAIAERDATMNVASTGDNNVAIHVAYPTAPGVYPMVVVGHGLSLPASEYYSYVKRLASFGYVALTVDFPGSPFSLNNTNEAKDMLAGIDWAKSDAMLGAIVDANNVGMTGHSLGGKVALLAATMDSRVKASIVLDPVDGGGPGGCTAPACVAVASLMPSLHIPTGFVGETTDSTGGFMPCAPAADNYTTFYAGTTSPSLEVTALGADHMSFLDDKTSCGVTCSLCTAGTASNAQVNGMARSFVVAFYERYLRGNAAYDAYLTGGAAQSRYVATSQATITSK